MLWEEGEVLNRSIVVVVVVVDNAGAVVVWGLHV